MDAFREIVEQATGFMMQELEREIRLALDNFWGAGKWSQDDLIKRCNMLNMGKPVETFTADGVPLLELYPVELHRTHDTHTDTGTMRLTRTVRRLWDHGNH